MNNNKKFLRNKKGQSSFEYIMIFLLVVVIVVGAIVLFGENLAEAVGTQGQAAIDDINDPPPPVD